MLVEPTADTSAPPAPDDAPTLADVGVRVAGVRASVRDRSNPDPFETMLKDPGLGLDKEALAVAVRDMRRATRRYVKPVARWLSLVTVFFIVALKRLSPFQFRAHGLIDTLCIWFMRRFVSREAAYSLIRHFVIETNLINFVARNCGADDVPTADLLPDALAKMGERTVMKHDINIYNLVLDLGESETADVLSRRPLEELDFSMLTVPPIDVEPERRRLLELDIESALYLMNIPFCLFTTEDEYERAVNSFQLDESLLGYLANLTGDVVFRSWTPLRFSAWLNIARDVPRDLYWHAIVNELAHTRLCAMRDALARGESWPPEGRGRRP